MANCILCNTSLNMLNKPTFGQGKLTDGNQVCFKCFSQYLNLVGSFKKLNTQQVIEKTTIVSNKADEIKLRIKEIGMDGISSFFGSKELKELPNILEADETLIDIATGGYNNAVGVVVLTQKRLLFIDKGLISLQVEEFPLTVINSIQYETGFGSGTIKIMASGNNATIKNIPKQKVALLVDKVREEMAKINQAKNQPVIINQSNDEADQLLKFADLRDKGIITNDEFEAKKKQLLGL